ncbi:sialate O-acetylesterase [Lewinella sp. IMCC34191]|uniref:sialate O-acetylesterase n=1 Tax=Lewinella sp. IMCC34191 TaxID=2259172 RepID=UPI0013007F94|nr:sialate O-acetylesterase [Lewinella sp. IMCC34191]
MRPFLLSLLFLFSACVSAQDLEVFELFTDQAVLQRDIAHPIWGWARPRRTVRITLDETTIRAKTDRDGRWTATLPATEAGGPHTISITDGRTDQELTDIYFGDVYLLSGQSNMEWRLAQSDPDSSRAAAIADPLIRQVLVSKTGEGSPQEHILLDESWKPGTKNEMADFSAVGAYFAHYLRESGVDLPIGLVHSSWGGSRIEPWIPATWQEDSGSVSAEDIKAEVERRQAQVKSFYQNEFAGDFPPASEAGPNEQYVTASGDKDGWSTVEVPGLWEGKGYTDVDGVFYYRKTFALTEQQARQPATLFLGPIDDNDLTYLNGTEIGRTNDYAEYRHYPVKPNTLRAGENVLTVRVEDTGGGGGFHGAADSLYLQTENNKVPLAGDWEYRIGAFRINSNSNANQTPTLLYNAMIAPLMDWPLTGVLWYQGESNAGEQDAAAYAGQMEDLIGSWREQFEDQNLPFYWVQLANYMPAPSQPDAPGWALLRAQQTAALSVPNTGQAIITDIGEAGDIHPRNKWEVGRRLSLHARKDIYGQSVQASSPVARELSVSDNTAEITFDELGEGLTLKLADGDRYPIVRSLTVRDGNGKWHWAVGTLAADGQRIRVINPAGTGITAVRYAWFNNPDDANLFSRAGLPVTPFELTVD